MHHDVIVSSTWEDLQDHRRALLESLHRHGLFAIDMERHPAEPGMDVIGASLAMVAKSDAYMAIISHRYGQVIDDPRNPHGHSVTHLEYEAARARNLPCIVFRMGEDHAVKRRHVEPNPSKQAKLAEFVALVQRDHVLIGFDTLLDFKVAAEGQAALLRRVLDERSRPSQPPVLPPSAPANFVGRGTLREIVMRAVITTNPNPVIVVGEPGSGKTSLLRAVAASSDVSERFNNRRWLVDLSGVSRPGELVDVLADYVGLSRSNLDMDDLLAVFSEAPALLALDNLDVPWHLFPKETEFALMQILRVRGLALLAAQRDYATPRGPRWAQYSIPASENEHLSQQFRLAALEHAPLGSRWKQAGLYLGLDPGGNESDGIAADEPVVQQLHTAARRRVEEFMPIAIRLANSRGWEGLSAAARHLRDVISCDTADLPARIGNLWDAAIDIGSFLEFDNRLHHEPNSTADRLEPEARRLLEAMVRTVAPWVRRFPTARALDDEAGAFLARSELFASAGELLDTARDAELVSEETYDHLVNLATIAS